MPPKRKTLKLDKPQQIRAISSPVRQELLTALGSRDALSVRELAERLGRAPSSLYYHVRELLKAGILVEAGERPSGKRIETIYAMTTDRILLDAGSRSSAQAEAATKAVQSILRLTGREVAAAIELDDVRRDGTDREIYGVRGKARLKRSELREVNRCITRIEEILRDSSISKSGKRRGTRMYAVTAILTPSLDKHSREVN